MKQTLLLLFFFLVSVNSWTQELVAISPANTDEYILRDLSDITEEATFDVKVTNRADRQIELKWTLIVLDQPEEWVIQVSDKNAYYLPRVRSNFDPAFGLDAPVTLTPGETFDLKLHIAPLGYSGTTMVQIPFAYTDRPNEVIGNAEFTITIEDPAALQPFSKASLKIYPNPAIDYFELPTNDMVDEIYVYNNIGNRVRTFRASNGSQYNISDLPTGLYLVSFINENKGVLKTVRLVKRVLRP